MSEWNKVSKQLLDKITEIKNKKDKDRLALCSAITDCNMILVRSVNGWTSWLSDPRIMKRFTEANLKEISNGFFEVATQFLKLDIKFSEEEETKKVEQTPNYIK